MSQAVDFSFSHPPPSDIPAGGFVGALRYLTRAGAPKRIVKAELDALTAAGVPTGFVFEDAADRALGGSAAGDADGALAAQQLADLGAAPHFVYAAVDFAPRADQYAALDAYFDAFGNRYRVEPYGDYDYVEHWCDQHHVTIGGWQTAAWSGMGQGSGGEIDGRRVSSCARLYQRVGYVLNNTSDANEILQADWGQWPAQGEDDVTHDELVAAVIAALDQKVPAGSDNAEGWTGYLGNLLGKVDGIAALAAHSSPSGAVALSDDDLQAIAKAVNDELARRAAG